MWRFSQNSFPPHFCPHEHYLTTIPSIDRNGSLTNADDLGTEVMLVPLLREVRRQLRIIVSIPDLPDRFRDYVSIWANFLRCSHLLSQLQQQSIVETTLICCIFKARGRDLAQIRETNPRVVAITSKCGSKLETKDENKPLTPIEQQLTELSLELVKAYRFSQRTFKTMAFFTEGFCAIPSLMARTDAIEKFIDQNSRINHFLLTKKIDEIAISLVYVMRKKGCSTPIEKDELKQHLQKLRDYEFKFKEWVESTHYEVIYDKVVQLFKKSEIPVN